MGLVFKYTEGQTPIDEGEKEGLKIKTITTLSDSIFNKEFFTWHATSIAKADQTRKKYIQALRDADTGNILPLIEFARADFAGNIR